MTRTTILRAPGGRALLAAGAAALLLAGCASGTGSATTPSPTVDGSAPAMADGASATVGDLDLTGFWVKESSLDLSAGFGTITNSGGTADALVAVSTPAAPMSQIHVTTDGVMAEVTELAVPSGGTLTLAPMGNHLMFMGLTEPLVPGGTVPVTLTFASGSTVTLEAPIKAFSGDTGHADGAMDDHGSDGGDDHSDQ